MRSILYIFVCVAWSVFGRHDVLPAMQELSSLLLSLNPAARQRLPQPAVGRATPRASPLIDAEQSQRSSFPSMRVEAADVYSKHSESFAPGQKVMAGVPSTVGKMLAPALLAGSFAGGYLLTPATRIPVQAAGALIAAAVGKGLVADRLENYRRSAAEPAAANLLAKGLDSITSEEVEAVVASSGLSKEAAAVLRGDLYLVFLHSCFESVDAANLELRQLRKLKAVLGMSVAEEGNQLAKAAKDFYNYHRIYLSDTEQELHEASLARRAKFAFLCDGVVSQDESPEGYSYEVKRLRKELHLSEEEWNSEVDSVSQPLYSKVVRSFVHDEKPTTAEELQQIRESLMVRNEFATSLHSEILRERLQANVDAAGVFTAEDKERLNSIQAVLGMSDDEGKQAIMEVVEPLYRQAFEEIFDDAGSSNIDAWTKKQADRLEMRQQELLLNSNTARSIEKSILTTRLQSGLREILDIRNQEQALQKLQGFAGLCDRLVNFMTATKRISDKAEFASFLGGRNDAIYSSIEKVYRQIAKNCVVNKRMDAVVKGSIDKLCTYFGLSESESSELYESVATDIFRDTFKAFSNRGSFVEEKETIDFLRANLGVPTAVTDEICSQAYETLLQRNRGRGISDPAGDAAARDVLRISEETAREMHDKLFGSDYVKALTEAMGLSRDGEVTEGDPKDLAPEDWERLGQEQLRLRVSDEAAGHKFLEVARLAVARFSNGASQVIRDADVEKAGDRKEMEKAKKKAAEALTRMVDYAERNAILVDGKLIPGYEPSESEAKARLLVEVFIEDAVAKQIPNDKEEMGEIIKAGEKLGNVLGLDKADTTRTYERLAAKLVAMKFPQGVTEEGVDPDAKEYMNVLANSFSLDDDWIASVSSEMVSKMIGFLCEKNDMLAEDVRVMIDLAAQYGITLADVVTSQNKREELFRIEMADLISTGGITRDDYSGLEEVAAALGVSEEKTTKVLLKYAKIKITGKLLDAWASVTAAKGDFETVEDITELSKWISVGLPLGDIRVNNRYLPTVIDTYERINVGEDASQRQANFDALQELAEMQDALEAADAEAAAAKAAEDEASDEGKPGLFGKEGDAEDTEAADEALIEKVSEQ